MPIELWARTIFRGESPGPVDPPQQFVSPMEVENPSTSNLIRPRHGELLDADRDGFPYLRQMCPVATTPAPAPAAALTPAPARRLGRPQKADRDNFQQPANGDTKKRLARSSNGGTPARPKENPKRTKPPPGVRYVAGGAGGGGHWVDSNDHEYGREGNQIIRSTTAMSEPQRGLKATNTPRPAPAAPTVSAAATSQRNPPQPVAASPSPSCIVRRVRFVDVTDHNGEGREVEPDTPPQSLSLVRALETNTASQRIIRTTNAPRPAPALSTDCTQSSVQSSKNVKFVAPRPASS
ncbi:hypothetical protein H2203_005508 [Taxawa tesnikishii (nom. ined.)]|nr:hypothetical protein H2203_005508 [Dothideales sp. JES 119]